MGGEGTVQLRNVCVKIGSGATPRGGKEAYKGGATALIRSQNIYNDSFHRDGLVYIDDDQAAELCNVEVRPNDVLLNITGDSVARCCQVAADVLPARVNQHVAIIRPEPKSLDPRFLRYVLVSHQYQSRLLTLASAGATRPALTKTMIEELDIPSLPLPEQRAIAAVLGALDDKIELNRRMNATLEAMARVLFQSWFVDFDPVRAKLDGRPPAGLDPATAALFPDSFQDSPLGHIPKGWEIRPLAEAFDIKDGATFKKEDRLESGSIIAFGANGPVGFSTRANVTEPCIALGKIGSCGSLHRSWNPCWITNNAFVVKPHRGGSLEFMWRTLCTIDFTQFIGGSANPYMPLKNFGHTPLVMPPAPLLNAYQERAGSLATKIVSNDEQSRTLATLRNTLLPKLLSGELSVAAANRQIT